VTDGIPPATVQSPFETVGRWIGPEHRPLLSWLATPSDGAGATGVVIVPPLGYEYWTSHRTLRTLAERLALQGCSVLRFDHDGTGDSAGDQWDPDRLVAWREGVALASAALRDLGVTSLVLIGLRVGGTLAILEGSTVGADAVVAWAPITNGRRYVREIQLLGLAVPEDADRPKQTGAIVQAGTVFSAATLADLGRLDLTELPAAPAPRVLIVDRDDKPASTALLGHLDELGVQPDHLVRTGSELVLDQPTEYATVADDIVDGIGRWVGRSAARVAPAGPVSESVISWRDGSVREEVVRVGPAELVAVLTRPLEPAQCTVVWLNSGSEHHVGPGRAWVEYARDLALAGYASLRLDFSGWGESPDRGRAPGRPYDQAGMDEVRQTVDALRRLGPGRIVVAGLCAGAWVGLRAALSVELDGVIAINPQLYWQPGDPVEADIIAETRVRRQAEIGRIKRFRRMGVWWTLDMVGLRHQAARWLRSLVGRGTPVLALFAAGDDGIEFLEDRIPHTWAWAQRRGTVEVVVMPDIDHPMHRHWQRTRVVTAMRTWLDAMPSEP